MQYLVLNDIIMSQDFPLVTVTVVEPLATWDRGGLVIHSGF